MCIMCGIAWHVQTSCCAEDNMLQQMTWWRIYHVYLPRCVPHQALPCLHWWASWFWRLRECIAGWMEGCPLKMAILCEDQEVGTVYTVNKDSVSTIIQVHRASHLFFQCAFPSVMTCWMWNSLSYFRWMIRLDFPPFWGTKKSTFVSVTASFLITPS